MSRSSSTTDGRHSRSEQTRAALLDAAARAFADKGYSGTRLAVVADEAGANTAAVSYHFGGKRALYDAVIARSGERFDRLFDVLLAQGLGEGIEALMARLWREIRAEADHVRIVLRAVLDDGHPPEGVTWMGRDRLPAVCETWAPRLGIEPDRLRMAIMSMNFLASRYAIAGDEELCHLTGAATVEEAHPRVVAHLADLARSLVGLPRGSAEG